MKIIFALKWMVCGLLMLCGPVQAAITCSVTSNGFTAAYNTSAPATNITAASITMSCTRGLLTDPTSQAFSVKVNNGLQPNGVNNQAAFGANRLRYDVFVDSACSIPWKAATTLSGTITFTGLTDTFSRSLTLPYWGCIAPGLNPPAGTYTDTVTLNPTPGAPATFGVTIITPAACSISTSPGNIVFNYASFQAGIATAATTFATTCAASLPYTLALDATSGTLIGLNYTLSLSASAATGTGAVQTFSINGAMAAGQAGTCSTGTCPASVGRVLTITY